ncbi:hypothetical protein DPEC_G00103360 [Dallia pectoralis]|uniref:Uncharacterized protein n=1 Tax=Dallia pectoralis TaxID=75939 RepID=A0ACC2GXR4_DALPE|nr:hypothetical protein DPEC_G00103360 [Dallia pectoralis]
MCRASIRTVSPGKEPRERLHLICTENSRSGYEVFIIPTMAESDRVLISNYAKLASGCDLVLEERQGQS